MEIELVNFDIYVEAAKKEYNSIRNRSTQTWRMEHSRKVKKMPQTHAALPIFWKLNFNERIQESTDADFHQSHVPVPAESQPWSPLSPAF